MRVLNMFEKAKIEIYELELDDIIVTSELDPGLEEGEGGMTIE